jgi:hypothetical protein
MIIDCLEVTGNSKNSAPIARIIVALALREVMIVLWEAYSHLPAYLLLLP